MDQPLASAGAPAPAGPRAPVQDISMADVLLRFTHHVPLDQQVRDQHDRVREEFKAFAEDVMLDLPEGREKSLAFTALEEASFWAHAAVARAGK